MVIFENHVPAYPLDQFVNTFFYFEGVEIDHNIDRFLPDGNTEIVIDLTNDPKFIYDNDTLKEIQTCQYSWVSGIRTEPICIPSGHNNRMLIINFKKGKAHPFYPFPLFELTDYVVDSNLVFGPEFNYLREELLESGNPKEMFSILERYLLNLGRGKMDEDPPARCVDYAVSQLLKEPQDIQLKMLTEKIGYSQKHFISLFKRQIGVTPKNYLKIMRFQKSILEIESAPGIDWSMISYKCGYYDQAHFINEFKKFSGFTPSEYVYKKSDQLNYVPVA